MTIYKYMKTAQAAVVAGLVALSLSAGAFADHHEGKAEGDAVQAGMDLAMANQLASYGDRNSDAMALIVAASIKQGIGSTDEEGEKESEGDGEMEEKEEGAGNGVDDILDRARALAGDNPELGGMIEDVAAMGSRGDVAGAGCYNDRVWSHNTDTWTITFTAGSNYVDLSGDGDTDLDLYVYDGSGRLICAGESYYDDEFCSWRQYNTGYMYVKVKNLGGVYNVYDLCTN